jgi:glycosyltransferase involved in cell wall biosynthesis
MVMIKDILTIVIPSKNERDLIGITLTLLNKQTNIIGTRVIISDSSDDLTREIISNGYYPNLKIEIIDGGLPSVARNKGASITNTPYVLFMDADIFLSDSDTISYSVKSIVNYNLHLITCKFRCRGKYSFVFPVFEFFRDFFVRQAPCAIGGYMLFDKNKFDSLGGFVNEDKFAEDFHLSSKINPLFFLVVNKKVYTTDRRFRKKGLFYMLKMAVLSMVNKDNPEFFKNDHNYWI